MLSIRKDIHKVGTDKYNSPKIYTKVMQTHLNAITFVHGHSKFQRINIIDRRNKNDTFVPLLFKGKQTHLFILRWTFKQLIHHLPVVPHTASQVSSLCNS